MGGFVGKGSGGGIADAEFGQRRAIAPADQAIGRLQPEQAALTLADLAFYAYVARAPEGGVSLDPYSHIRSWLARVESMPRFVPMPEFPQR